MDFRIAENRNVLLVGNSMGENGLNDSVITNWKNVCRGSDMYFTSYPMLKKCLEANPNIDTVVITAGIPAFDVFNDKYVSVQKLRLWRSRVAFFDREELKDMFTVPDYSTFITFMLSDDRNSYFSKPELGAYQYLPESPNTFTKDSIEKSNRGYYNPTYSDFTEGYSLQIKYLKKIISLCKQKRVTCVLMSFPIYEINRWYGTDGYMKLLSTLDNNILIADYSRFNLPDKSYFIDINHLNYKGALYLSHDIMKKGLKCVTLRDYLNNCR